LGRERIGRRGLRRRWICTKRSSRAQQQNSGRQAKVHHGLPRRQNARKLIVARKIGSSEWPAVVLAGCNVNVSTNM
jgi:hypothetical protein